VSKPQPLPPLLQLPIGSARALPLLLLLVLPVSGIASSGKGCCFRCALARFLRESPPPETAARFLLRGSVRAGASSGEEVGGAVSGQKMGWIGNWEFSGPGVGSGWIAESGTGCFVPWLLVFSGVRPVISVDCSLVFGGRKGQGSSGPGSVSHLGCGG
jgi:hypothetical protein